MSEPLESADYYALIEHLEQDGKYRWALFCIIACTMGLRVSDVKRIHWQDILAGDLHFIDEKKTGKNRRIKINDSVRPSAGAAHLPEQAHRTGLHHAEHQHPPAEFQKEIPAARRAVLVALPAQNPRQEDLRGQRVHRVRFDACEQNFQPPGPPDLGTLYRCIDPCTGKRL